MADVQIARALPLAGMVHGGAEVTVSAAPAAYRISLRAGGPAVAALSKALGVTLPKKPGTSASAGSRARAVARPGRVVRLRRNRRPRRRLRKIEGGAQRG